MWAQISKQRKHSNTQTLSYQPPGPSSSKPDEANPGLVGKF